MAFTSEMVREWNANRVYVPAKDNPNFISKGEIWQRIRRFCIACSGTVYTASDCDGNMTLGPCSLQPYRLGHKDNQQSEAPTKIWAIFEQREDLNPVYFFSSPGKAAEFLIMLRQRDRDNGELNEIREIDIDPVDVLRHDKRPLSVIR
jgi:hypothetical protein